jgi:hypothetical protein
MQSFTVSSAAATHSIFPRPATNDLLVFLQAFPIIYTGVYGFSAGERGLAFLPTSPTSEANQSVRRGTARKNTAAFP